MSGVISGMRIRIASVQGSSQVGRYVKGKFGETLNDTQLILVISRCDGLHRKRGEMRHLRMSTSRRGVVAVTAAVVTVVMILKYLRGDPIE